jgi:ABC-type Fe3+-siderophore transport system permease subunit
MSKGNKHNSIFEFRQFQEFKVFTFEVFQHLQRIPAVFSLAVSVCNFQQVFRPQSVCPAMSLIESTAAFDVTLLKKDESLISPNKNL